MPLLLAGGVGIFTLLLYFGHIPLILLVSVALVKGALITQVPIFEIFDFSVILSILVGLAVARRLMNARIRERLWHHQYIIMAFLIWVCWMMLASTYAPNLDWAIYKSLRFAAFTSILFLAPLVLITTRDESWGLLKSYLVIGVIVVVIQIGQLWLIQRTSGDFHVVRLTVLGANPIGTGRVLAVCAAMAATLLITGIGNKRWWGVGFIVFLTGAMLTGSRGPILALFMAVLVVGLLLGKDARRRTVLILGVLIVVFILTLLLAPESLTYRYRLYKVGELAETRQGLRMFNTITYRMILWGKALTLWLSDVRHFLFGDGTAGYARLLLWRDFRYPHNLLLELLAEYGILGAGVFSMHIFLSVKQVYARFRASLAREEIMWLAGLVTYFLSTLVSGDLNDNRLLWFFLAGLLATVSAHSSNNSPAFKQV